MKSRFLLLLFLLPGFCFSEGPVDSLNALLKTETSDTAKLRILVWISLYGEFNDIEKHTGNAITFADKLLADRPNAAVRSVVLNHKAVASTRLGSFYEENGDMLKTIDRYFASLKLYEESGNKKGAASSMNDVGFIFEHQGDIPKALDYYSKSLAINEEIGNEEGIAQLYNNIGFVYKTLGDHANALNYYDRSLKFYEKKKGKEGIGRALNNIGHIYKDQGNMTKALEYYEKGLKLYEEIDFKEGTASLLGNMGAIYRDRGDHAAAMSCYTKGLRLYKEIHQTNGQGIAYISIARIYFKEKKYALAHAYADSSLAISKKLGYPESFVRSEGTLSRIDSAMGNYASAFEHYKQYIMYRDSIDNRETRKAGVRNQLKYEYDKKEAVLKETQEKERALAHEKSRVQQIVIWCVVAGLCLVLGFAVFVFRSLKKTRMQKHIIEEKQREILDSIHYARRIQRSLITSEKFIGKELLRFRQKMT